jgi:hypothetical protein
VEYYRDSEGNLINIEEYDELSSEDQDGYESVIFYIHPDGRRIEEDDWSSYGVNDYYEEEVYSYLTLIY